MSDSSSPDHPVQQAPLVPLAPTPNPHSTPPPFVPPPLPKRPLKRGLLVSFGVGLTLLVASLVGLAVIQSPPPSRANPIGARLELAAGDVTLKRDNQESTLISGVPLPSGAELHTGKGARALVRLSDGSSIVLRSDSRVMLGEAGVTVSEGEMWLDAPPSERGSLVHKIGDTTISAADAGLSMRMEQGGEINVVVTRGLAVVNSPAGRVEVNAGEQAKIAKGAAPKVSPMAYWDDWTGGMGDNRPVSGVASGAGRIYGIDKNALPGTAARTLEISRQSVQAVLRDGLAETQVDQTFSNPGGREVEGWYWFTLPERAIVTSFAVETNGALVEGEVIEKQEAAAQYARAVVQRNEPALLEWIDGRSYRARIFPVPASGSRRVVLRYMELLSARENRLEYVYPMRSDDAAQIGEFSLNVDLGSAGVGSDLSTLADAVVEDGGKRVSMRRSGYTPRADFQLEVQLKNRKAAPLRVGRFSADGDRADYLMARYAPDFDWQSMKEMPAEVAIVVDTSASGDESARSQKAQAAEAVLRALSGKDKFALIALDGTAKVLHPKDGLAEANDKEIAAALTQLAEHASGGATDLGAMFDTALSRVHGTEQPAIVYIGDGLPTSGEVSGEKLAERLRRSLSVSRARFFTVAVGLDANYSLLSELSREGGGQPFRIAEVAAGTQEVLRLVSAVKTPTITDLSLDFGAGLDEVMVSASGKVSRGEEVILLARTHHALPKEVKVKGRLGAKDFERVYPVELERGVGVTLIPRLWATEKMKRLLGQAADPDQVRGKVVELGLDYGLMTPFTSILSLESERAYSEQGIRRRYSPLRGGKLTLLDPITEDIMLGKLFPPTAVGCNAERSPASESKAAAPMEQAPMSPTPVGAAATAAAATGAGDPLSGDYASAADEGTRNELQKQLETAKTDANKMKAEAPAGGGAPRAKKAFRCDPGDPLCAGLDDDRQSNAPAPPPPPPAPGPMATTTTATAPQAAKPRVEPKTRTPGAVRIAGGVMPEPKPQEKRPKAIVLGQCSDSAKRPLSERIVLWSKRLRGNLASGELINRYEGAKAACEIADWRAEAALLDLIQAKVRTAGAAEDVLRYFSDTPDTQRFVAHAILRRSVDLSVTAAVRRVLWSERVRWAELDNELAEMKTPEERIERLKQVLLEVPGDPEGEIRLVRLLADAGKKEEAFARGRRLRDQGLLSPALAIALGDVLAAQGFQDEAIRTYSELVEFDSESPASRKLLGDILLRHGWYAPAYRQYKSLTEMPASDASSFLRMAAAAAGTGRVDEALRIQRQVANAEGTPGPDDPRQWARLLSAARLARLLAAPDAQKPSEPDFVNSVTRKLKELGLFSGPSALVLLTWEDYEALLSLAAYEGDKEVPLSGLMDASPVGLVGLLLPAADLERLRFAARWKKDSPGRDVKWVYSTLIWDGKAFQVKVKEESLSKTSKEAPL